MDIKDREDINVDHKNLVRYDCRKINLRRATDTENSRNKNFSYMSSSGIVGVKQERSGKWLASITINSKPVRLGLFDTIEEAAETRFEAELKYYGEFRYDPDSYDTITDENLHLYETNAIA